MHKWLYIGLGVALVVIGLIGVVLPLLPSTVFFILAAGCFARSNERLEAWILRHRTFGPPVRAWREHGAIAPPAKLMAVAGMGFGYAAFLLTAHPGTPLALAVAAALVACAAFVVSRPSGAR